MDIILDEKQKAEEIIENKKIYKNIWHTKALLIKYYKSEGKNEDEIRHELEKFLNDNVKILNGKQEYNIVKDADNIERAIRIYTKEGVELSKNDSVKISKNELDSIREINNLPLEKLAFILLVLCKVNNIKNNKFSKWINYKTKDFYKYTKNREWGKGQEIMIGKLFKLKLLDFPNERGVDKTGIKIKYIDSIISKEDTVVEITNFKEVVLEYLKWRGEKVITCEQCGTLALQSGNRKKYCSLCWKEKEKEDNRKYARESMRKRREKDYVKGLETPFKPSVFNSYG